MKKPAPPPLIIVNIVTIHINFNNNWVELHIWSLTTPTAGEEDN